MSKRTALSTLLALLFLVSFSSHAQAQIFQNGDFETGDLTGWTVVEVGAGLWEVYSGTTVGAGIPIEAPPQGIYASSSWQGDPGSSLIYQDISVPVGFNSACSLYLYYNTGGPFNITGDINDLTNDNQQGRIDIIEPNDAQIFSITDGILDTVFVGEPGDPLLRPYGTLAFDLSPYAGTTVRFRVAAVGEGNFIEFAVDDIHCSSAIPTLGEWSMIALAAVLGVIGFIVIRRRAATA